MFCKRTNIDVFELKRIKGILEHCAKDLRSPADKRDKIQRAYNTFPTVCFLGSILPRNNDYFCLLLTHPVERK